MRFVKVIYFDEGTAADYMQITSGGELRQHRTENGDAK